MTYRLLSFVVASLIMSAIFLGTSVYAAGPSASASSTTSLCQPTANPFVVTGSGWGLSGSPVSVSPGDDDVPMTVTLLYSGPCTATSASFELSLPQSFTTTSGANQSVTYEVDLAPYSAISETYYLDVSAGAAPGTYDIPLEIGFNTSSFTGLFFQSTQATIVLRGSVTVSFGSSVTSLYPGTTNNLTLSITNLGSGTATSVTPTVTSGSQVAILNQLSRIANLPANSTDTESLQVYVPSSLAGSAVSLLLSATYYDAYSTSRSVSQSLGFSISTTPYPSPLVLSTSTTSLTAGEVNNVTFALFNQGGGNTSGISVEVSVPSQVVVLNQPSSLQVLEPGSRSAHVVEVFVPSALSGSALSITFTVSYEDSLGVGRSSTQTLGFLVQSTEPAEPFVVQEVAWGTSNISPQPGDKNVPLLVDVQYLGTETATALEATLTLPDGFTDQDSHSTAVAYVSSVNPDQVAQIEFYLDLGSFLVAGNYSFPVSLTWATSASAHQTEAFAVSPSAVGEQAGSGGVTLSLSQSNDSVVAGTTSSTSFVLENAGTESIFSPVVSLTVSSPLVVMSNPMTAVQSVLRPGQSADFSEQVASSPSASLGVYGGTLTVTYTDLSGTQHSQTFSVGFVLTGTVEMVLQDVTVSQASSSVTVSGSILNEGTASAYYASVSGTINHSATGNESADYIGEVDPNTPTPFSVTIPYPAPTNSQQAAQVTINVAYKNVFGKGATAESSTTASLESATQLFLSSATVSSGSGGSGGGRLVTIVSFALIAVLVIAAVVGIIVVRRTRSGTKPKKEERVI